MRSFILSTAIVFVALIGVMLRLAGGTERDVELLLETNDIATLESAFGEWQAKFETGELTEFHMRGGYRSFYELDATAAANLRAWAAAQPKSYAAHAALGVYLDHVGLKWRGTGYVGTVSNARLVIAGKYFAEARAELEKSLGLTPKPYMSLFYLLQIAMQTGDRTLADNSLAMANAMAPANRLVRGRYAIGLLPQWGGSYDKLHAFIEASRDAGAEPAIIAELQAIEENDVATKLFRKGDMDGATTHFTRALELAKVTGGTVVTDFLAFSAMFACERLHQTEYCGSQGET